MLCWTGGKGFSYLGGLEYVLSQSDRLGCDNDSSIQT